MEKLIETKIFLFEATSVNELQSKMYEILNTWEFEFEVLNTSYTSCYNPSKEEFRYSIALNVKANFKF